MVIWGLNFTIGAILTMPLAIFVGRSGRVHSIGGVPKVYQAKNWINFPNLDPSRHSKFTFNLRFALTCALGGYSFAQYFTDGSHLRDELWNRPDLKPRKQMLDHEMSLAEEQVYKKLYYK